MSGDKEFLPTHTRPPQRPKGLDSVGEEDAAMLQGDPSGAHKEAS